MEKPTLPGALTYHKLNTDVICDIFQAFEADFNPILGVVQIAQMQHDDLVTILGSGEWIYPARLSFLQYSPISNYKHLWIHVWLLRQVSNKYFWGGDLWSVRLTVTQRNLRDFWRILLICTSVASCTTPFSSTLISNGCWKPSTDTASEEKQRQHNNSKSVTIPQVKNMPMSSLAKCVVLLLLCSTCITHVSHSCWLYVLRGGEPILKGPVWR